METRPTNHSFIKVTKKEIEYAVKQNYVVFHDIKWDTDGQKVELPKAVAVPKENFDVDTDFSLEGADYLSDKYGWCVKSFSFKA